MPDITTSADVHTLMQKASLAEIKTYLGVEQPRTEGVLYIRTHGNDATAEPGNPSKPFLTVAAALASRTFPVTKQTSLNFGRGTFDASAIIDAAQIPGQEYYGFFIRGVGMATVVQLHKNLVGGDPGGEDQEGTSAESLPNGVGIDSDKSAFIDVNIVCGNGGDAGATTSGSGHNGGNASQIGQWNMQNVIGNFLITTGVGGGGSSGDDSPNNDGTPGADTTIEAPQMRFCDIVTNGNISSANSLCCIVDGLQFP
jgi:hypothetical protein